MLVLIGEEKKCSMIGSLGKWWISTADPLKDLSSFKEREKSCEWSSQEMEEQLKKCQPRECGNCAQRFLMFGSDPNEPKAVWDFSSLQWFCYLQALLGILSFQYQDGFCVCVAIWQCWSNSLTHGNAAAESQEEQGHLLSQGGGGWSKEGFGHRLEEEVEFS